MGTRTGKRRPFGAESQGRGVGVPAGGLLGGLLGGDTAWGRAAGRLGLAAGGWMASKSSW
jgi:hypothetical protein